MMMMMMMMMMMIHIAMFLQSIQQHFTTIKKANAWTGK